ncbi:MAG: NADH:flavin oxidoreductase [Eubacteriaceae bacterium]|jgi:2,4-dienoyl-CoA reductase-like NADH-dependent reductase (Old Yellow Enzyme family)|nr:NADH:flavin oxidoreductase [Eubacteriaceae bacterium]
MNLFDTTKIKNLELKNRFFKAATWEALADEDGHITEELYAIYDELTKGGAAAVITGYSYVTKDEKPNPGLMGIYDDVFIDEYRRMTENAHENGAGIFLQIVYGGSNTGLNPPSRKIFGPSAVTNIKTGITPVEMTAADIKEMVQAFADAAVRAEKAGFDGVEIHGAHGYLLSMFMCPKYNIRTDEYGGTTENRARFICEIITAIKKAVSDDFIVMIKQNSSDCFEGGLTSEDSLEMSKLFEQAGVDVIDVSGGNSAGENVSQNDLGPSRKSAARGVEYESYFLEHAKKLAEEIDIPVILTGGNRHFEVMDEILNHTKIRYFALGRPLIREPGLFSRWESGDLTAPLCISCNACNNVHGKRCIFNQ